MIHEKISELTSSRMELRDRIITTSMSLFVKNGIRTITMDDIANTLSISKRTLYEIFEDKETLLMEACRQHHETHRQTMEKIVNESDNMLDAILQFYRMSLEMFHSVSKRFFEDLRKYPKVREMIAEWHEEDADKGMSFFMKGIEQGVFRDDVNFRIWSILVHEQMNLVVNSGVCKDFSFLEVYESIVFIYVRGICTEKGWLMLEEFIKENRAKQ